jgi:ABC-type uncharacterized transport system auxiliary subunit
MKCRAHNLLWIAALSFVLSGCISIGGSNSKNAPPPSVYTLRAGNDQKVSARNAGKGAATIFVARPEVPNGFETERIALYFEQGHRLDYYADAAWSGRLDAVLQDFFVQAVTQGLAGKAVGVADPSESARYKLAVKITDFQPVYPAGPDSVPRLDVGMTVTLSALPGGETKGSFTVKRSAPASANRMSTVTKGLEDLLRAATSEALARIAPQFAASPAGGM